MGVALFVGKVFNEHVSNTAHQAHEGVAMNGVAEVRTITTPDGVVYIRTEPLFNTVPATYMIDCIPVPSTHPLTGREVAPIIDPPTFHTDPADWNAIVRDVLIDWGL